MLFRRFMMKKILAAIATGLMLVMADTAVIAGTIATPADNT